MNRNNFKQFFVNRILSDWIPLTFLVGPYIIYAFIVKSFLLFEVAPDHWSYMWESPINFFYFTGRSLTQRVIFSLCMDNRQAIVFVQLFIFALTALVLYALLRREDKKGFNLALSSCIAFLFSSYTFNISSTWIGPEHIFISLLILFPFLLFCLSVDQHPVIIFLSGLLLIFSKSVAPFIIFSMIAIRLMTERRILSSRSLIVYASLGFCAIVSIIVTDKYDTSRHINTVNNCFNRIFPNAEATKLFHSKYGMPTGPFVVSCSGGGCSV